MDSNELVCCTVCGGTKTSPLSKRQCLACKGKGEITKSKQTAMMNIRKKLSDRLAKKGFSY